MQSFGTRVYHRKWIPGRNRANLCAFASPSECSHQRSLLIVRVGAFPNMQFIVWKQIKICVTSAVRAMRWMWCHSCCLKCCWTLVSRGKFEDLPQQRNAAQHTGRRLMEPTNQPTALLPIQIAIPDCDWRCATHTQYGCWNCFVNYAARCSLQCVLWRLVGVGITCYR